MLEGITAAEFGRIFSAPLAGMILADLGARVIKVERRDTGDESRHYGIKMEDGISDYFFALNRKKEILQLDLKDKDDLQTAYGILKTADVLIHNSLQGSFDRLGLSYETVHKLNPKLIYAAISGYGEGKYRDTPSQDITIQALSGFMNLNGADEPVKTGVPVIDYVTGQYLVIGILAALIERRKTGRGRLVRASLLESAIGMTSVEAVRYLNTGVVTGRHGNRHTSIAPYNSYAAKDGRIIIAVANDAMFMRLAEALDIPAEGYETNEKRLNNIDKLETAINNRTSRYQTAELAALLKSRKISCEPVNDIAGALASAEFAELDMTDTEAGRKYIKMPLSIN